MRLDGERASHAASEGEAMSEAAEVTRCGALDMQVCVPAEWTDEQVKAFADRENAERVLAAYA